MSNTLTLLFTKNFYEMPPDEQREVYMEYFRMVYPMVFFIVKDYQATEDIIQESFLRTLDRAGQLNDVGSAESWLRTVARNVTFNFLRKLKKNRNELDHGSVFSRREPPKNLIYACLEEEVEAQLLKEDIVQYMNLLKPEYRLLVELRSGRNCSYKEIALLLGTSESVVRQRLYRARESVKQKLRENWGLLDGQ
ncbi:RNA polymerase sigma factor [Gorillibacterium sp. sgz5001074]|uniref:RNA polymerase sigma factor n=1 Tax=Gorillibacterium sp. sgz5001074 TaxID=3446695 RepID=UPI003F679417